MLSYNSVEVSPVKDLILMYAKFGFAFDLSYWFNKLGCSLFDAAACPSHLFPLATWVLTLCYNRRNVQTLAIRSGHSSFPVVHKSSRMQFVLWKTPLKPVALAPDSAEPWICVVYTECSPCHQHVTTETNIPPLLRNSIVATGLQLCHFSLSFLLTEM